MGINQSIYAKVLNAFLLTACMSRIAIAEQPLKPLVHVYQSSAPGPVNTYWIEAPAGIIVLDTQRSLSSAHEALAEIQRVGKPVVAILVSHPHDATMAG